MQLMTEYQVFQHWIDVKDDENLCSVRVRVAERKIWG